ncbi:RagB/SusD family nutrient uptake outer membrane protein [Chitinophaga sp. RAB17]|uniref:RagB/SusD family nutrient uptake outer membrane protein n=1 Tax=Chitinophaga sp. RAB17 TaxID=3233049 RepID=UPI003F908E3F
MKKTPHLPALYTLLFVTMSGILSCNKLVDVPLPIDKVTATTLFQNDAAATTAVLGIYSQMMYPYLNLTSGAVTIYTGLSSDELISTSATETIEQEFADNTISVGNDAIQTKFWLRPYVSLYQINTCISGLTLSTTLSPAVKNQLLGESKFARAFIYFYMINLFGDVPYETSTDYEVNKRIPRTPVSDIKKNILSDLTDAVSLLTPNYPTTGHVRPNRFTALALLARYYLYEKKWKDAESIASQIIDAKVYSLTIDLNGVFLPNSTESIWQLIPIQNGYLSLEGSYIIPAPSSTAPPKCIISRQLMDDFEKGDKRLSNWTNYMTIGSDTFYYPYKYKNANPLPDPAIDYFTVFRLAEQYLIRAEARTEQGNIKGAIDDLNMLRDRARDESVLQALPKLPYTLTPTQTTAAVKHENRIEFFCEWGHRWFDLIRHNEADRVLKPLKPQWKSTDALYPIPFNETRLNTTLTQNPGYN